MESLLLLGFFFGIRHAMEADHMAALASMATREFHSVSAVVRQGIAWGVGHSATLLLFGGMALVMEKTIPERLANGLEVAVGVMLMALGADLLRRIVFRSTPAGELPIERREPRFPSRALAVGLMHGMAGSAALILLALSNATSLSTGLLYILAFGAGSTAGMAILSSVLALPLRYSAKLMGRLYSGMSAVVGLGTLVLGASMVLAGR